MEPEVLRFLLIARAHLREEDTVVDTHADMQAIERALPDVDWFELAEVKPLAWPRSIDLWASAACTSDNVTNVSHPPPTMHA